MHQLVILWAGVTLDTGSATTALRRQMWVRRRSRGYCVLTIDADDRADMMVDGLR